MMEVVETGGHAMALGAAGVVVHLFSGYENPGCSSISFFSSLSEYTAHISLFPSGNVRAKPHGHALFLGGSLWRDMLLATTGSCLRTVQS